MRPLSLVAGAAVAAGAVAYLRRRGDAPEHVDLYYEDGSIASPQRGAPETERILVLARDAIRAVRA